MTKLENIENIILNNFNNSNEEVLWKDIVTSISSELKIKNWMVVRNVLQKLINELKIKRIDDIQAERYVKI